MTRRESKTYRTFVLIGLSLSFMATVAALNACSPLSPSISKFAGASSSQQPLPQQTDLSSETVDTIVHDQLRVNESEKPKVKSYVISKDSYVSLSSELKSPSLELSTQEVGKFMSSGFATFHSTMPMKDLGTSILGSDVNIYYIVAGLSKNTRFLLQNSLLTEFDHCGGPLSPTCNADWKLKLKAPSITGDPALDTDPNNPRNILFQNLIGIAVEFDLSSSR